MPDKDYNNTSNICNTHEGRQIEMTVSQVAEILGVHKMTVGRYLKKGILPYRAINLKSKVIPLDDLRQFAAAHKLQIDEDKVKEILAQ
jgi:excisionase family DNA binding protein